MILNVFDQNHSPTECDVLALLNETKNRIQEGLLDRKDQLEWTIDSNKLSDQLYLTYPLLITYIFHILEKDIVNLWLTNTIEIWFCNVSTNSDNY